MKKLLSILLTICLLLSAGLALAEEDRPAIDTGYPFIAFGEGPEKALAFFDQSGSRFSYSRKNTEQTVKLSGGLELQVITREKEDTEYDYTFLPSNLQFFFRKGQLIAATQEIFVPEGTDLEMTKASILRPLSNMEKRMLNLADLGFIAEMLKNIPGLKDGMEVYHYTTVFTASGELKEPMGGNMLICFGENKIYVAEFPDKVVEEMQTAVGGLELAKLNGYDQLSDEQKALVQAEAKYLQYELTKKLENYIEFLVNNP